jgi:peptide/nickel transport system ATP-binding protein
MSPDTIAAADQQISPILHVKNLSVAFSRPRAEPIQAVRDVSWSISRGEVLALVGESGSGKSVSTLAVMGLLAKNARTKGSILWNGQELLGAPNSIYRTLRGNRICLVPQDPMASLNPVYTIGYQIREGLKAHQKGLSERDIARRIVELLDAMSIPRAAERANSYPHELSGGMRQRVVIAMALANNPDLIIADEATTALDVTVQAQVLESLSRARELTGAAVLLITHDLGVVAGRADRVAVMRYGEIVEQADVEAIFYRPLSAYTRKLLASVPRLETLPDFSEAISDDTAEEKHPSEFWPRPDAAPLLSMIGVEKHFHVHSRSLLRRKVATVRAVGGVDLSLRSGQTLAIVGESGSGKSTLIRTIFNLEPISGGKILFEGKDIHQMDAQEKRVFRSSIQMVFQDPYASLNPMMTIRDTLMEPAIINGMPRQEALRRAQDLLERVHLAPEHAERYPNEFSGGQRQRIAIARALMLRPKLVVLDEPVSSLDVSIQAEVLGLLAELQRDLKLSYLFVSHDLSVVASVAHHVVVMYHGRIVERGLVEEVYSRPRHPYTRALLSAVPIPDPRIERQRRRLIYSRNATNIIYHDGRT